MRFRRICALVAVALLMVACVGCDASVPASEESSSSSPSQTPEATKEPEVSEEPTAAETTASESATTEPSDDASDEPVTLPTGGPDQTISFLGTVTNVDLEENLVTVTEEVLAEDGEEAADSAISTIDCVISDDTIIIDALNGKAVNKEDLMGGTRVFAFVSPAMTRSIPPQSNCYALVTNISDDGTGIASYIKAMEVSLTENGDLVVLNQNADLYVTIPVDLAIETLDGGEAKLEDIDTGSVFIAWYDMIMESYPAQTTATKVVLCSTGDQSASASPASSVAAEE